MARLSGGVTVSSITQVPGTPVVGPLVIVAVPDVDDVEVDTVMLYAAPVERPVRVRTPPAADAQTGEGAVNRCCEMERDRIRACRLEKPILKPAFR